MTTSEPERDGLSAPAGESAGDRSDGGQAVGATSSFVRSRIEDLRLKLLDLSLRNTLINYKFPRGSSVTVTDEHPNSVAGILQGGTRLKFAPLPVPDDEYLRSNGYITVDPNSGLEIRTGYPDPKQWARELGISTSSELRSGEPEARHRDGKLQTLLYPSQLEAKLRAIRGKANWSIREMGCHVLFLAVGFIEYFESEDSDQSLQAPIFTLPVRIDRTNGHAADGLDRYYIERLDTDVLDNITLSRLFDQNYGFVLPPIEENEDPETFFKRIESGVLKRFPRWRVRRRIALGVFSFHKQGIYVDLDPANWPRGARLEDHPIVRSFFEASGEDDASAAWTNKEYDIDAIEGVDQDYPLIADADSSQHSAIIHAIEAGNLVIEGPPGTGKSQTITNLIAALIGSGKSVLFVAEKMAALEVVKARLDKAGLGEFCLELHGYRAQKAKLLESINYPASRDRLAHRSIQEARDVLKDTRDKLNHYAECIDTPWKETGLSAHSILVGAARYRVERKIALPTIEGMTGESLTPLRRRELKDVGLRLEEIHRKIAEQAPRGELASHYWSGVRNVLIAREGGGSLLLALREWNEALKHLAEAAGEVLTGVDLSLDPEPTVSALRQYWRVACELPTLTGDEDLTAVSAVAEVADEFHAALKEHARIHECWESLQAKAALAALRDASSVPSMRQAIGDLRSLGVSMTQTPNHIRALSDEFRSIEKSTDHLNTTLIQIRGEVPDVLLPCFEMSRDGISKYAQLNELLQALPPELWRARSPVFEDPAIDPVLAKLEELITGLLPLRDKLVEEFDLDSLPSPKTVERLHMQVQGSGALRWFSRDWREARRALAAMALPGVRASRAVDSSGSLLELVRGLKELECVHNECEILGALYSGVDTPVSMLLRLRSWYQAVQDTYGRGFGPSAGVGRALLELDEQIAAGIMDTGGEGFPGKLAAHAHRLENACTEVGRHPLAQDATQSLTHGESGIGCLVELIESALQKIEPVLTEDTMDVPLEAAIGLAEYYDATQEAAVAWNGANRDRLLTELGFELSVRPGERRNNVELAARTTLEVARILRRDESLLAVMRQSPTVRTYKKIADVGDSLGPVIHAEEAARAKFSDEGDVDLDAWMATCEDRPLALAARNNEASRHPEWLADWANYLRVKAQLVPYGLADVLRVVEEEQGGLESFAEAVTASQYCQLGSEIVAEHPDLQEFFGPDHDSLAEQFRSYDREVMALNQRAIAMAASGASPPPGKRGGLVGQLTEMALITHEKNKQRRHIAIRDLVSRSRQALLALKPCFMMSPMSVATHLRPGPDRFDVVIMDEASQIKPEDALGAIARGNSLVVVGDPRQLPPTSFFERLASQDDDIDPDDEVVLQGAESILDSVSGMFPTRRLRWHYRSRHPSLIAFSNSRFYQDELILFPSPFEQNPEFGVKYRRVEDGFFDSQVNRPEARAVVDCLQEHLRANPKESVGIVAMNTKQKDAIEQELESRIKGDPSARTLLRKAQMGSEPVFVKNLESVQGDERDVIIISMTYGPLSPGGAVPQRFGPINSPTGWRRLNVLFSRAKKRMIVFCSMDPDDVLVDGSVSKGRRALHDFIEYCAGRSPGAGTITTRPPDSDFEIAVGRALRSHGYSCEMQLGVAGYFLDIAVRHPDQEGRFLLGIECDGASYHSAKSARDRDRLRQDVLEGLGWRILRIWSTDWFRNPVAQVQRVLNALEDELRS